MNRQYAAHPPGAPAPPHQPPPGAQQYDWSGYHQYQQQQQRAGGQPVPIPQQAAAPPPPPSAEHAALYANYGYGNQAQWTRSQPPPPPPAGPPMHYQVTQYPPAPTYQSMPVMYSQPPQQVPFGQPPLPHPMQQQQQQPSRLPLSAPGLPPQPHYYPVPPAQNRNGQPNQGHPPAKRPRFDSTRGPSVPAPYATAMNAGPVAGPTFQTQAVPMKSHATPMQQTQQPMAGPQQQHGRFPPQQPPFKSGNGSARGSGRGTAGISHQPMSRGGSMTHASGRGRGGSRGGGNASGRGAGVSNSGSIRGGRGGSNGSSRGSSFRNQSFKSSNGSSHNLTAQSFNPQLPLSHFPSSGRGGGRHSNSFTRGDREGTPKRDDGGSKKTLTDFRIVGIDCPSLGWSWGTVEPDITPEESQAHETQLVEEAPAPPATGDESTAIPSDSLAAPPVEDVPPPPPANPATLAPPAGPIPLPANPTARVLTETSRIRLYFNSPVELDEKPPQPTPVLDRTSRGGKRKKEHDDEGEPEEGGKRKKEDTDVAPTLLEYVGQEAGPTLPASTSLSSLPSESSIIGAKRKARSLTGDEDDVAYGPPSASSTEQEAQTEYAGSPHQEDPVFDEAGLGQQSPSKIIGIVETPTNAINDKIDSDPPSWEQIDGVEQTPTEPGEIDETQEISNDEDDEELVEESTQTTVAADFDGTSQTEYGFKDEDLPNATPLSEPPSDPTLSPESLDPQPPSIVVPIVNKLPPPSPNRISISYAGSSRRLVLDAEIITSVKIFRSIGKIEVRFVLDNVLESSETKQVVNGPKSIMGAEGPADATSVPAALPDAEGAGSTKGELSTASVPPENDQSITDTVKEAESTAPEGASTPVQDETAVVPDESKSKPASSGRCRGILVEVCSTDLADCWVPIAAPSKSNDPTLPDFSSLLGSTSPEVTLTVFLDRKKPLSEPKWVRMGEIDDWLNSVSAAKPGPEDKGQWSGKIDVVDPDPPPTIHTLLEAWTISSAVGSSKDRRRFLTEHIANSIDNIFEILLRLVRGSSSYHGSSSSSFSAASIAPSSSTPNAPHAPQQTPISLAVLGIYRMAAEYAEKAEEEHGKLEERVGNIVRSLPHHMVNKSLDGIFRDWAASVGITVGTNSTPRKK